MSHRQVLANYGSYSVCSAPRDVNALNLSSPSSRPLTPICELWTKNPQTGYIMERHLWTKNPH